VVVVSGGAVVVVVSGGAVVVVVSGGAVVVVAGGSVVVVGGCVVGGTVVVVVGGSVVVVGGWVVGGTVVVVVGGSVVGGGSVGGGGGKVPGRGWNCVGKVVVVVPGPPTAAGRIATLADVGCRVVGRLVLNPSGVSTDANRLWSCSVTVDAGAGEPALTGAAPNRAAPEEEVAFRPEVLLLASPRAEALISGPRALALPGEPPGRRKATSDTAANTRPATSIVASICSSVLRARSALKFGTRPMPSALP
jgi:hypothetical protein